MSSLDVSSPLSEHQGLLERLVSVEVQVVHCKDMHCPVAVAHCGRDEHTILFNLLHNVFAIPGRWVGLREERVTITIIRVMDYTLSVHMTHDIRSCCIQTCRKLGSKTSLQGDKEVCSDSGGGDGGVGAGDNRLIGVRNLSSFSAKTPLPMTKLPQAPIMGVGVHKVVEMYATSLCDTEPMAKKESVVSSSTGHDFKRRSSEITQDTSPRPLSPGALPTKEKLDDPSSPSDLSTNEEEITKRTRLEGSATSDNDDDRKSRESYTSRKKRFMRTAEALRQSGLLDITMKTADLLRKNQELQREIEDLQRQTKKFVRSVLSNPENRQTLENIRSGAQLYEVVVPGSQGIMSVSMQQTDVNMNVASDQRDMEAEDSFLSAGPQVEVNLASTIMEADSGFSCHSPQSDFSPSPASSISNFSNDTSSLSEDLSSSEDENLSPPKLISSNDDIKPH
ncbi:CLOCK-interacting pacemaker [Chionoecetes opilio]|uniref:CLOCK-interacting pacemaker n=1 Tax=Chionoecetes opilio TaxID=41210 RepID=A0A8J4Y9S8_CHIOP|nr:CLOCK-interacting pacemaker [Chionoecetes opilio]